jgi:hypothetical protein
LEKQASQRKAGRPLSAAAIFGRNQQADSGCNFVLHGAYERAAIHALLCRAIQCAIDKRSRWLGHAGMPGKASINHPQAQRFQLSLEVRNLQPVVLRGN